MLSAYLGITDNDWFDYVRRNQITDEVNFWIPSGSLRKLIEPDTPWLLELRAFLDSSEGRRRLYTLFHAFTAGDGVSLRQSPRRDGTTACTLVRGPARHPTGIFHLPDSQSEARQW